MKATIWLRIASILTLIHAVLHTAGGVFGKTPPGPASVALEAMRTNQFVFMGASRNLWEFYRGMGLAVTIFLTIEGIVFWQLGSLANSGARLRPVLAAFTVAYVAMAVNSYLYFFAAPVVVELLIAACLVMAMAKMRPTRAD